MNTTMDVYDINMLFYGGITKPRKSGSMGKFELWVLLLRCPEQTLMMRFYWIERQIRWNYLDRDSRHILGETSSCCCGIVVLMIVRLSHTGLVTMEKWKKPLNTKMLTSMVMYATWSCFKAVSAFLILSLWQKLYQRIRVIGVPPSYTYRDSKLDFWCYFNTFCIFHRFENIFCISFFYLHKSIFLLMIFRKLSYIQDLIKNFSINPQLNQNKWKLFWLYDSYSRSATCVF